MPKFYDPIVFGFFLRYLIKAAEDKRVLPYHEIENVFALSHNMVGYYAGCVANFCMDHDWALYNALLVNTKTCMPSEGFDDFLKRYADDQGEPYYANWGEALADCWADSHRSTSRKHQVANFTGLNDLLRGWSPEGDDT